MAIDHYYPYEETSYGTFHRQTKNGAVTESYLVAKQLPLANGIARHGFSNMDPVTTAESIILSALFW